MLRLCFLSTNCRRLQGGAPYFVYQCQSSCYWRFGVGCDTPRTPSLILATSERFDYLTFPVLAPEPFLWIAPIATRTVAFETLRRLAALFGSLG